MKKNGQQALQRTAETFFAGVGERQRCQRERQADRNDLEHGASGGSVA